MVGREFGEGVRIAIEQTGLTHRKIAQCLGWDEAKLSCVVNGKGGVDEADVRELLAFCRVGPEVTRHLLELFRESRENGWLISPGYPKGLLSLFQEERLAKKITSWSMNLIPGRLQTTDYVRALVDGVAHDEDIDYDEIIKTKIANRAVLHHSREFVFFIHEQALHLPVGGPDVMKDQLIHLLGVAERSYITVRILPTSVGAHAGLGGTFVLLQYERHEPVVYTDGENNSLFLEDKQSLATYTRVLKKLDEQALEPQQSKELIRSHLI